MMGLFFGNGPGDGGTSVNAGYTSAGEEDANSVLRTENRYGGKGIQMLAADVLSDISM